MKLCASTPVTSTTSTDNTRPRPGMSKPNNCFGCHTPGKSSSVRSIAVTIRSSTQRVTASGTQISSPVIRYFLSIARLCVRKKKPRQSRGLSFLLAGSRSCRGTAAAGRRCRGRLGTDGVGLLLRALGLLLRALGLLFRRALGRFLSVRRFGRLLAGSRLFRLFFGALGTVLEVGGVPAATLELEAGSSDLLGKRGLAARGANRERRIGQFLHDVRAVPAGRTSVGVDRHDGLGREHDARISALWQV